METYNKHTVTLTNTTKQNVSCKVTRPIHTTSVGQQLALQKYKGSEQV